MCSHRILYIHPSNELYGADRSLLRLVKSLNKGQYQTSVVIADDLPYEGLLACELDKAGITYQKLALGVLRRRYYSLPGMALFSYRTMASALRIASNCRMQETAIIHSNSSAVVAGGLAAWFAHIPHVWHVREIVTQPAILNSAVANVLNLLSSRVVAVSVATRNNLIAAQPRLASKTVVINNGIDPEPFLSTDRRKATDLRRSWGISASEPVIGMVGRISAWKGQELLVRAFAQVAKINPTAHLVLVGGSVPGERWRVDALRSLVADLEIVERVHLEDFRLDIPLVLSAFDIFCLPSIRPDPFPTVVLEAMASGKPVVALAHGGVVEQVEDGVSGLLVTATDPADLASALNTLLNHAELRSKMGVVGRQRLLTQFTVERYVRDIDGLYGQILSETTGMEHT